MSIKCCPCLIHSTEIWVCPPSSCAGNVISIAKVQGGGSLGGVRYWGGLCPRGRINAAIKRGWWRDCILSCPSVSPWGGSLLFLSMNRLGSMVGINPIRASGVNFLALDQKGLNFYSSEMFHSQVFYWSNAKNSLRYIRLKKPHIYAVLKAISLAWEII